MGENDIILFKYSNDLIKLSGIQYGSNKNDIGISFIINNNNEYIYLTGYTNGNISKINNYLVGNVFNEELKKDIGHYIELNKDLLTKNIFTSSLSRLRKNNYNTDGILELIILSYMFPYPIVVFDNYNAVKYIFSSGPVSVNEKTIEKYTNTSMINKAIFMKFDFEGSNNIPKKIYSIYYN